MSRYKAWLMHPNSLEELKRQFMPGYPLDSKRTTLYGRPIITSEAVAERSVRKTWFPPNPEKFVEYTIEDEAWMRPLGLGTVKEVDQGPLILEVDLDNYFTQQSFEPPAPIEPPLGVGLPVAWFSPRVVLGNHTF